MSDKLDSRQIRKQRTAPGDAVIGRAFRWSLLVILLIGSAVGLIVYCSNQSVEQSVDLPDRSAQGPKPAEKLDDPEPPTVRFTDITTQAGIDFVHVNGAYGDKLLPETMGSGVAFLDYDQDRDQDLLLVNARHWPGHEPGKGQPPTTALYRNDGRGQYDRVKDSGLAVSLYGTGVAVGDYDNDGWPDLFITALGENRLFHNDNGRFHDLTHSAQVAGNAGDWSTGSAFLDYDQDGDLDLFVANYVRWSKAIDFEIDFRLTGIGRAYGPPTTFSGSHAYLYRNDGNGVFTDVSAQAGVQIDNPATGSPMGKALGVIPVDLDRDGWLDVFVANDTVENFTFRNLGDGRFEETGTLWGLAFDRDGAATGAMGADAAYFRNDQDLALVVGNFANEMTSLYVTQGGLTPLADEAIVTGIGPASRLALSFGVFFFDYDLDGRLDLFQTNGHLEEDINRVQSSQHYEQPAQLFWNCGLECRSDFVQVAPSNSGDLTNPLVGRAAAYGDIDGDGDLDIVLTQVGRRPVLLRNDQALEHHWLRIKLVGRAVNRDAIGAWVEVVVGDQVQRRQVMPTRSYLSQVELPLTFGLGTADTVDSVRVNWPDGTQQQVDEVKIDSVLTIQQPL